MTSTQLKVAGIFISVLVLLIIGMAAWDVYLEVNFGVDATISRSMQRLGVDNPIVAFVAGFLAVGIVCGLIAHFWGRSRGGPLWAALFGALAGGVIFFIACFLWWQQPIIQ
jgi:hypothetical protein